MSHLGSVRPLTLNSSVLRVTGVGRGRGHWLVIGAGGRVVCCGRGFRGCLGLGP